VTRPRPCASAFARDAVLTQLLQQRLLSHLQELARPRHAQWDGLGLMGVRAFIHELLAALGPVEANHCQEGSEAGTNLILRLPDQNSSLDPLPVGAHYDGHLQSIGADDNATGLAALLELARRWRAAPAPAAGVAGALCSGGVGNARQQGPAGCAPLGSQPLLGCGLRRRDGHRHHLYAQSPRPPETSAPPTPRAKAATRQVSGPPAASIPRQSQGD
jgi:hypothetical protein